jgi:hypothetical protein
MEDILRMQIGIDTGRGVRGELRQCFHIPLFFNAPQVEGVHVPSWVDAYRARVCGVDEPPMPVGYY